MRCTCGSKTNLKPIEWHCNNCHEILLSKWRIFDKELKHGKYRDQMELREELKIAKSTLRWYQQNTMVPQRAEKALERLK